MLTVIEGGRAAEEGDVLTPRLVRNTETGRICLQVSLGQHECNLPLPEEAAGWDKARLEQFMANVVPEITKNLQAMAAKDRRKTRERARKAK